MSNVILVKSDDGSHTLFVPDLNEHYHSTFGAINESMHVYIRAGLHAISKGRIRVLEVGFGTGLNALLTYKEASSKRIDYVTYEKYPIGQGTWEKLNYGIELGDGMETVFSKLHQATWGEKITIGNHFSITKIECDFRESCLETGFDLVYFDAFGPDKQPDLWVEDVFVEIYKSMNSSAILVTYCAKGVVRRMLEGIGFKVERLPGPPPKKEMLRASKA